MYLLMNIPVSKKVNCSCVSPYSVREIWENFDRAIESRNKRRTARCQRHVWNLYRLDLCRDASKCQDNPYAAWDDQEAE